MTTKEGERCKVDSECENELKCKMFYQDEEKTKPLGRYCSGDSGKLRTAYECSVDTDCPRGECVIERSNGSIRRICKDNDELVYEDEVENVNYKAKDSKFRFFSIHPDRVKNALNEEKAGPVAELIVFFFSTLDSLLDLALSSMYSMFMGIFDMIAGSFLRRKGDLIFNEITRKNKDGGFCFSMWTMRTILTIILPPYGVFMARGIKKGGLFRIILCCILTAFFYFPGLIYALIITHTSKVALEERKYTQCLKERKTIKHVALEGNDAATEFEVMKNPFNVKSELLD
jgi:uncharacterized membrane protein YqaE (UPF0057 family)